jgi:hypothetical protein
VAFVAGLQQRRLPSLQVQEADNNSCVSTEPVYTRTSTSKQRRVLHTTLTSFLFQLMTALEAVSSSRASESRL